MTDSQSKTTSDQSVGVQAILHQGIEAAQRDNWLEVINQLKQLPLRESQNHSKQLSLNSNAWQIAFNLALEVLINADFQHRWEISKFFPLLGNQVTIPLNALVIDETTEAEVRWFICQILGNFPHQSVVLTLVQLLQQSNDQELITIAGKTLIKIGDRAINALVELLSQPEYCLLAAKSLSYIRSASTIAPLLTIATHENSEVRAIAINALGSFHDHHVPSILITALKDQASIVRKEAAIALGFRPDLCESMNLVQHLQPLLYDLNLEVCSQTATSLGRMQQSNATTALFEVLQAPTTPMSLKLDLIKALGWSESSSAITYLEQALNNSNELIMGEIITVLGHSNTLELKNQSTQVLVNFWQRQQPLSTSIKQILTTALGELGELKAQTVLEELVQDGDRKVQLHAMAALKKLAI